MGYKVLYFSVALLYLMICEHVRAQCTQPSFETQNVILSGSSLLTQSFPDKSTVTLECKMGHKPVNSRASKSVTCEGNQWTSLELTCTRKSCGGLDLPNGRYEGTGILFGDRMTAVCNTGYTLTGQIKDRWCRDQGWDGRDPVCEAVTCEPPPAIENGQLEEEPQSSYDYSQVVSYKCNNGLSLIGSRSLHCSEDGTFKPDPPQCIDYECPKPEIKNAVRVGGKSPPYKLKNFIDYKCEEGYTMKGDGHIVCETEGWKPDPPKCLEPCMEPVFKGHVTFKEKKKTYPDGSNVIFECMPGFEPIDPTVPRSVTCVEKKWSELLLTCKAVKCNSPPTIENGQLEDPLDDYYYPHVVSYKCNEGFTLTGSLHLQCSEDRTFKPEAPKCSLKTTTSTKATTTTKVTFKIQPKDGDSTTLSPGYIALVVLGVGVLLVISVALYCYCKKRSKHEYSKTETVNEEKAL